VAEPHWMSYVGMVTGIVGAITGVAGAIMGYLGYRRSDKLKVLDLRLELRKAVSDARVALEQLRELIHTANRSRVNNFAARGLSQSGTMIKWNAEVKTADLLEISKLCDFHAVEPHFPAQSPGTQCRRFPVILDEADIMIQRTNAEAFE